MTTDGIGRLGHSSFTKSCSAADARCFFGADPGGVWTRSVVDFYVAGCVDGFAKALFTSFIWTTMRRNLLCCRPGAFVQWMGWYDQTYSHRDLPMLDGEFMEALSTVQQAADASGAAAAGPAVPAAASAGAEEGVEGLDSASVLAVCDAARRHSDGALIACIADHNSLHMALSWVAAVRALNRSFAVFAVDSEIRAELVRRGVPTIGGEGVPPADMRMTWVKTKAGGLAPNERFAKLGGLRSHVMIALLRAGCEHLLFTDADVLFSGDPVPFVLRFSDEAVRPGPVLVSSDFLNTNMSARADGQLEDPQVSAVYYAAWNVGLLYWHRSALPALEAWHKLVVDTPEQWEQALIRTALEDKPRRTVRPALASRRLFTGFNGTTSIGVLPVDRFCNGHTYFVQRLPQRHRHEPIAVHPTFLPTPGASKMHRLREATLVDDPPEYYSPPQGVLAYTPRVRLDLARPSGVMGVEAHMVMMHEQLSQLRSAWVLAQKLGRVLVLPTLTCGLDRLWWEINGTIPGTDTPLPISPCPADLVLDLEVLMRNHGRDGRLVALREYSFLQNPRLPAELRTPITLPRPPSSLDETSLQPLRAQLAARPAAPLLFGEMPPDLYEKLPPSERQQTERTLLAWAAFWCCTKRQNPKVRGAAWYDMFWDQPGHVDRHGRVWNESWRVILGP